MSHAYEVTECHHGSAPYDSAQGVYRPGCCCGWQGIASVSMDRAGVDLLIHLRQHDRSCTPVAAARADSPSDA